MNKSVVTGILVRNDKGNLLLVKKPDGVGPYAGMYLTPGGGVKTGEAVDNAVLRELYEETGVKINNLKSRSCKRPHAVIEDIELNILITVGH